MLFELVYRSVMALRASPSCVADIVRVARRFNRGHDITGVLFFDGARFWQLLEGDRDTVVTLANRIEHDPRHEQFELLHQHFRSGKRRFASWSLAYVFDEGAEFSERLARTSGPDLGAVLEEHARTLDAM